MFLLIVFLKYLENSPSMAATQAGSIIAFLGYLWILTSKTTTLSSIMGKMQQSVVILDRINNFLSQPEYAKDSVASVGSFDNINSIIVDSLSGQIDGKEVFRGLSFSAYKGDMVVFKGKSGCGKTTLIRTLFGFNPIISGKLLVNSTEVPNLGSLGVKAVMLPQEIRLLSGPLKWNLEILSGRTIDDKEISVLFEELELDIRITEEEIKETDIRETGSNLSGGEKQRLALAALLLRKPDVVLLDEPTAHVDLESEMIIISLLKSLAQTGAIVLVSSHSPAIQNIATIVLDLEQYSLCIANDLSENSLTHGG